MQNNNSKVKNILFVIVIILLAIGIWMLTGKSEREPRIESDQQVADVVQEEPQEEEKLVDYKPEPKEEVDTWPYPDFLKVMIDTNKVDTVHSFTFSGSTYYRTNKVETTGMDGSASIYNSNGQFVATCANMVPLADQDELCQTYDQNGTKTLIYTRPFVGAES
jgi:hypothetical protein